MYPLPSPEPHLQVDEFDGAPDATACGVCGQEDLTEDDRAEVEGDVMCRGCAVARFSSLMEIVLGHDYRRAVKVDSAKRLNAQMPTLKGLLHELEREMAGLLR